MLIAVLTMSSIFFTVLLMDRYDEWWEKSNIAGKFAIVIMGLYGSLGLIIVGCLFVMVALIGILAKMRYWFIKKEYRG
jgi:hypothetical protein